MKKQWENFLGGFTLVELLVVMAIIFILVGIAVPAVKGARDRARNTEVKAGVNKIHHALVLFATDHNGFYPGMNWVEDTAGALHNGPALRGGTPSGALEDMSFTVPKEQDTSERYLGDGVTPDPDRVDVLVRDGYLIDYPANPFLRTGAGVERQMTNLFYFGVPASGPVFSPSNWYTWNWPCRQIGSTMRIEYERFGRGNFTYIPVNPVNPQGIDYEGMWGALGSRERANYYKYVRSFVLVGWGATRADDSLATGLSQRYWSSSLGGFDLDQSLTLDRVESSLVSLIRPHMVDSSGGTGAFGVPNIYGTPDIDPGFFGATIIISPNE